MDYKKMITNIINRYFPVSKGSTEVLIELVEVSSILKGTTFIKINTFNDYDYFLLSGICRSYIVNQKG